MSLVFAAGMACAQTGIPLISVPNDAAGVVTNLQGTLKVNKAGASTQYLEVNSTVKEGDVLSTSAGTFARLKMVDGAELILRPNSRAEITQYVFKPAAPTNDSALITLLQGGLRSLTGLLGKRNPERVTYRTSTATIGIRGTEVGLRDCNNDCEDLSQTGSESVDNGTHVEVTSGAVEVFSGGRRLVVRQSQFAVVRSVNSAPRRVERRRAARQDVPVSIRSNVVPLGSNGGSNNVQPATPEPTALPTPLTGGTADNTNIVGSQSDIGSVLSGLPPTASGALQQTQAAPAANINQPVFMPSFSPIRSSPVGGGGRSSVSPN